LGNKKEQFMDIEHLCTFTAHLERTEMIASTPRGRRVIGPIVDSTLVGEHLEARQVGTSSADWLVLAPDGTTYIDVRIAFRTHDGAYLYMSYGGRADWSEGIMSGPVFSTPVFETQDERYAWLNPILCVGRGRVFEGGAEYAIGRLR
jgi:hypothetical protein